MLKIFLLAKYIKENFYEILNYLIKGWLIFSVVFVTGYISGSLKIPLFFAIGLSIGIGWHMYQWLLPPKKEINFFLPKEIIEIIKNYKEVKEDK